MQKIKIGGALIIILVSFLTITMQAYAYDAPVTEEGISPDVVSTSIPHTHSNCYVQQKSTCPGGGYAGTYGGMFSGGWTGPYYVGRCEGCGQNQNVRDHPGTIGPHEITVNVKVCGLNNTDGTISITRSEDTLTASITGATKINGKTFTWYCYDDGQLSETLTGSSIPRNHESYSLALKYTESMGVGGTVWINNYKDDIHHVFLNDTKPIQVYLNGSKISGLYYDLPGILPAGKTKRNYLYFGH